MVDTKYKRSKCTSDRFTWSNCRTTMYVTLNDDYT